MNTLALRRLPSADWIAFGLAVAALCLQYVYPVAFGLIALAVFAPSILREIGLLNDTDEWSTGIMHRAGVHALVMVGLALLVRRRPRVGGLVLLSLLGAVTLFVLWSNSATEVEAAKWGVGMAWLQAGLIFGTTGVALLREK